MKFILLSIISLLMAHGSQGETITLGNGEWEPYQSQKIPDYGYASKIVTEAFKLEGITVDFKFYPWARSFNMAQKGKLAGTFLWGFKKEREDDFFYSDPILDVSYVFFYLKKNPFNWNTISDLKGKKIATTIQYSYGDEFDQARKRKEFYAEDSKNDETNFRKLIKGRIDITPNDLDAGLNILKRNHKDVMKQVTYHKKPVRATPHYLLISKKFPNAKKLVEAFNRGLKALKQKGIYDQIIAKSRKS